MTLCVGLGCGDDDGDDDGADTGGSGSESTGTATATASVTDSASASVSASASASATVSASATDSGTDGSTSVTDTSDPTSEGSTAADTGPGDSDTTAGADDCVGLGREECMANAACAPIACNLIEMTNNGVALYCIGDVEFLGCQSAEIACAEVRTTTCMGDDAPVYVCPNACIPADWIECEPPAPDLPPC